MTRGGPVAVTGLVAVHLLGMQLTSPPVEQSTVTVAAIQDYQGFGDGEQSRDREQLTRDAARRGARLIVWSELGLGNAFNPDNDDDPVRRLARELRVYLVVGYIHPGQPRPYNAAALIGPQGQVLAIHHKRRLFLGERSVYQRGQTAEVVDTAIGKLGLAICFDNCFTDVLRDLSLKGADLVAMPNFDPPVHRAVIHWLHTAFTPIRAVENRVTIVRADASGLSEVVDRNGRLLRQAPLLEPSAVIARVEGIRGTASTTLVRASAPSREFGDSATFFSRSAGDVFAYVCAISFGLVMLWSWDSERRGRSRTGDSNQLGSTRPAGAPESVDPIPATDRIPR